MWKRLRDRSKWPRCWWNPLSKQLEFQSDEDWQRQHDEASQTTRRAMMVIVSFSSFCILTLSAPDEQLLSKTSTIAVPFANTKVSFASFLFAGPAILIGICIYLHVFLGYLRAIGDRSSSTPLPHVFNLKTPRLARYVSGFIFYWLTPVVLGLFYWKSSALVFADPLLTLLNVVTCSLVFLQIRRCPEEQRLIRTSILWLILLLLPSLSGYYEGAALPGRGGANLYRAKLSGQNLSDARLFDADLREADLSYTNLRGAFLTGANLNGSNLSYADLRNSYLGSHFKKAKLEGANLEGVSLPFAHFEDAILLNANLKDANLEGAFLQGADLRGAILNQTNLKGAHLNRASLQKADLRNALLKGVILRHSFIDSETQIEPKWRLVWEIVNQSSSGRQLAGADLSWADLSGAMLERAQLVGAKFVESDLRAANLRGADLSGADLTGSIFWNTRLEGADLSRTIGLDRLKLDHACLDQSTTKLPDYLSIFDWAEYERTSKCEQ